MRIRLQNVALRKRCCIRAIQAEGFISKEGGTACQLAIQSLLARNFKVALYTPSFTKVTLANCWGLTDQRCIWLLFQGPFPDFNIDDNRTNTSIASQKGQCTNVLYPTYGRSLKSFKPLMFSRESCGYQQQNKKPKMGGRSLYPTTPICIVGEESKRQC